MGRNKQTRPRRAGGIVENHEKAAAGVESDDHLHHHRSASPHKQHKGDARDCRPFFVEVDRWSWASEEPLDISELVLTDINIREGFSDFRIDDSTSYVNLNYSLRFKLQYGECKKGDEVRMRLGHWPILPASSICLQFIQRCAPREEEEMHTVIFSGTLDGPDEGVSGLLHLASLKFLTLRPVLGVTLSEGIIPSVRLRAQLLKSALDACESVLETSRQPWKKSMMSVMAWLRPEVTTSEARYGGVRKAADHLEQLDQQLGGKLNQHANMPPQRPSRFDAAEFYEAIKPSKGTPVLEDDIAGLLPVLRPYQSRAAFWMVQREKGTLGSLGECERSRFLFPLCMPIELVDSCSRIFYNPFSGNVSLCPVLSLPHVFGGILADEMGLGKTVELLACIFAHRKSASEGIITKDELQYTEEQKINLRRLKRERVECVCGALTENPKYKGLWVQCDICDAWQHADCVGYSSIQKTPKPGKVSKGHECKSKVPMNLPRKIKKKSTTNIVVVSGEYICHLCSKLIQATDPPVATGATLIVCPAPILLQWHAEIIRHTKQGSLNICIYEGVRNVSLSMAPVMDVSELVSADIVLTTYDVLREDLLHDSDGQEGDHRMMRFQKRYPVIPTPLTRIFWWRICLDEAQMVESNTAAAAEMALRLHTRHRWCITGTPIQSRLDDLYGLLKFLKASPFDVLKWWNEVIRDPYEGRDTEAMKFTHKFFKQIMWRSSKFHVADELQLPPQEECFSWLLFSPVEEYFYERQHESCVGYANEVIERFKDETLKRNVEGCLSPDAPSDIYITQKEAAKLFSSLLKLRQACCHPQVGSSGLRSLQHSPMSMEDILKVFIHKTKIEGEEALRRLVLSINALAATSIVDGDFPQAVSLYKEALAVSDEHSEDFRLDPLLNIHTYHNLAESLLLTSDLSKKFPSKGGRFLESSEVKSLKRHNDETCNQHSVKRTKMNEEDSSDLDVDVGKQSNFTANLPGNTLTDSRECYVTSMPGLPTDRCYRTECEDMKQKYLSLFISKLSHAQQEFMKSYLQVCDAINERKGYPMVWWLEALHHVEQSEDFSTELIRKIKDAVSGDISNSRSSRIFSSFRSINALKYHVQTSLDLLEASRLAVLDRLLEINQTMENPKEEDVVRVRYCPDCYGNGDGRKCIHCELDELFQVYEARLFRSNKVIGGMVSSAEEAVDLQRKKSARNHFYWALSQPSTEIISNVWNEERRRKRDVGQNVVVSKSPSEVEVVLGVIKSYSKAQLGREAVSAAVKHLLLLEGMRKEYAHARSLAIAQAQILRAHDEIKMATSRLCLREDGYDNVVAAFTSEELVAASVENSNEKFISMTKLAHIKGKLRYLQGLVQSKQKQPLENPNNSLLSQDTATSLNSHPVEEKINSFVEASEEDCPICHEKLSSQKMVFQCGHVTCCTCLFAMSERRHESYGEKWLICPTCRQHTKFDNIAYADDGKNNMCNSGVLHTLHGNEKTEALISVQGSYGTKIEAVTKRILWIISTDPNAKVLVFSSWNDVLDVLEHAFTANCVNYIRMKGGRKSNIAISHFRGRKNSAEINNKVHDQQAEGKFVQVLLLLIRHGANGLNLLEAQHVVLVEPLLNPAAEAQAISRVHRIGQENRTLVHRFIVKKTVEESIYTLNISKNRNPVINESTKSEHEPVLTLSDVESLFATVHPAIPEINDQLSGSLMHLPPSVAASIAAERRRKECTT